MIGLERPHAYISETLFRSADGRSRGASHEGAAVEASMIDPAVERMLDWKTTEGNRLYFLTQKIAKDQCKRKNAGFAEAEVETSTYVSQRRYLEAAIECRKDAALLEAFDGEETNEDDKDQSKRAVAKRVEKREMVLQLIPHLNNFEETIKKCEEQSQLISSGRAQSAYSRRYGIKEKPREDRRDLDTLLERQNSGWDNANLQQQALAAEIDQIREDQFRVNVEKIFDNLLIIEEGLSSANGLERQIYAGIRCWRQGRAVLDRHGIRAGRAQDFASEKFGVSGDLMRSRAREVEAWARFALTDPKGHLARFVAHLRQELRNLGPRSRRHAFYEALIRFEATSLHEWKQCKEDVIGHFRQIAFDSELSIEGDTIDVFQRERWKARMRFLDTLRHDDTKTE